MVASADYYDVLGVGRDARPEDIRDAFRKLALEYHPDRNRAPGAEQRFKEIAEAYAVLSDPNKRAQYDMHGPAGTMGFSVQDLFGGIDLGDLLGDLGLRGPDLFEGLFGFRKRPRRGADLEAAVEVPLELVLRGGEASVTIERMVACAACSGSGARAGTRPRRCPACGGSGSKVTESAKGAVEVRHIVVCPDCAGSGQIIDEPCAQCGGKGKATRDEILTITIPPGVEEGMVLRIAGHGLLAPSADRPSGDLLVRVHSRQDPRFIRRGTDLWRKEAVELVDAVLGTTIRVPTLEGDCDVRIPAGTQPETVLRLRNKGLPPIGQGKRGNLLVAVTVHIPEKLSAGERRLYESLRAMKSAGKGGHSLH